MPRRRETKETDGELLRYIALIGDEVYLNIMASRSEHARYRAAQLFLEDPKVQQAGPIPPNVSLSDLVPFVWAVRAEGVMECSTATVVRVINELYGKRANREPAPLGGEDG